MQDSKEWTGGWGLWWLAPVMLWLGVAVAAAGGYLAWQATDTVAATRAIAVVLAGAAFILAGVGLYVRCSSCCDDCDWEEHPTNTTEPHVH